MTDFSGHTPGPWVVDATKALGAYGVWTDYATHPGHDGKGYGSEVCSVFRGNESDFDQETRNANAALIAAAPDLLAERDRLREEKAELLAMCKRLVPAMEEFLRWVDEVGGDESEMMNAARALIAKHGDT